MFQKTPAERPLPLFVARQKGPPGRGEVQEVFNYPERDIKKGASF